MIRYRKILLWFLTAAMILPLVCCIALKVCFTPESEGVDISGAMIYLTVRGFPIQDLVITESQINSWAIMITILLSKGAPFPVALLGGIASGALIGLLNGYMIGVQKLNHFIATFATMNIAKGAALVICNGQIINSNSDALLFIGTGKILKLFVIVWFSLIAFFLLYFMLNKTTFGYRVYSVGGSENVSQLSGINTRKIYIISFIISGILAAIGGLFMAGKANSGNATMGDGYEFNAIATVLIGGTPFDGGKGGLMSTFIGALFISILKNGIALIGLTPAWQYFIIGIAILLVIIMDVALNERRKRAEKRRVEA